RVVVGFNERLRFYRYNPGQAFKPHRDGSYCRHEQREASRMTLLIYLNDDAAGGETRFFSDARQASLDQPYVTVNPRAGMALVFLHRIWHEGAEVRGGRKLVLRTDVLYGRELTESARAAFR